MKSTYKRPLVSLLGIITIGAVIAIGLVGCKQDPATMTFRFINNSSYKVSIEVITDNYGKFDLASGGTSKDVVLDWSEGIQFQYSPSQTVDYYPDGNTIYFKDK
jgi:hypothetical protein